MIKVVAQKPQGGKFPYSVEGYAVQGHSRQPLLDACRQLQAMGVDERNATALFHGDSNLWSLRTTVGYGAKWTVDERKSPRFRKYEADRREWA